MRVLIDELVYKKISDFYYAALQNHPSLTKEMVDRKIWRMEQGLRTLERMQGFRKAWLFAYEVCIDETTDEQFVWIRDVIYGGLYH